MILLGLSIRRRILDGFWSFNRIKSIYSSGISSWAFNRKSKRSVGLGSEFFRSIRLNISLLNSRVGNFGCLNSIY